MSMQGGAPAPQGSKTTVIIIVVAAVLLLCCCGLLLAVGAWACGDMLLGAASSCGF